MSGLTSPGQAMEAGRSLIDLADRLFVAHKCAPGSVAEMRFKVDGVVFHLVMRVDEVVPKTRR